MRINSFWVWHSVVASMNLVIALLKILQRTRKNLILMIRIKKRKEVSSEGFFIHSVKIRKWWFIQILERKSSYKFHATTNKFKFLLKNEMWRRDENGPEANSYLLSASDFRIFSLFFLGLLTQKLSWYAFI